MALHYRCGRFKPETVDAMIRYAEGKHSGVGTSNAVAPGESTVRTNDSQLDCPLLVPKQGCFLSFSADLSNKHAQTRGWILPFLPCPSTKHIFTLQRSCSAAVCL